MHDAWTRIAQMNSKWKQWSPFILLASLSWPLAVSLQIACHAMLFHGDTTYPESAVVFNALLAAHDGHLYHAWELSPFTPSPYGPVYYFVLALVAKVFPLGHQSLLLVGRVWSYASYLGAAVLVYLWTIRLQVTKPYAVVGAVFFAGLYDFVPWNVSTRPDFPALLLMALGLFIYTAEHSTERNKYFAAFCFAIGLLVKESFIAAPVALFLSLLIQRRFKPALVLTAVTAAIGALCLLVLAWNGDPILSNLRTMGASTIDLVGFWRLFSQETVSLGTHFPLLLCLAMAIVWRRKGPDTLALHLYLFFAWLLGAITLLHHGSNTNVLIEAWFVTAIFGTLGMEALGKKGGLIAVTGLALLILFASAPTNRMLVPYHLRPMQEMPHLDGMLELVAKQKVLSDDIYLEAQSADPVLLDPFYNTQLEQQRFWSPVAVIDRIQNRRFDLVMLVMKDGSLREYRGMPFMSPSILESVGKNYVYRCHMPQSPGFSELTIWSPNDRPILLATENTLRSIGCH